MLENKLHEELTRYKQINNYAKKMIMEQEAPAPAPDPAAPPADPAAAPVPDAPMPPMDDAGTPPADPAAAPATDAAPAADSTEEVDVTDLVNMTKSIKDHLDNQQNGSGDALSKIEDVFTKLNDLEAKLSDMNQIISKIDELGAKVEQMKPESPQEKLEMRSLDSYPFNQKPQEFFAQKQGEMQRSGKNEYVLTKDDVSNYPQDIKNTFNPNDQEEDEYKF